MSDTTTSQTTTRHLMVIFELGVVVALLLTFPVWQHESDGGAVFGRFSGRYAAFAVAQSVTVIGWLVIFALRQRVEKLISALPPAVIYGGLLIGSLIMTVGMASGLESTIKTVVAANWLLITLTVAVFLPAGDWFRRVTAVTFLAMVVLLPFVLVAAIASQGYFPDEAGWAERSLNLFIGEGIYKPTYLQKPFLITPGYGWILLPYGWTLHNIAFAQATGRVWIFGVNLLMVLGVYALTYRLYGRRAAMVSATVAFFSLNGFAVFDFKARHLLKAAVVWVTFAAMQARFTDEPDSRYRWDFAAGLLATLAMQLHASAIGYAVSLSLLYISEYALGCLRARRLVELRPLVAYGIGASIGTAFYVGANVLTIGGFDAYLSHLTETRFSPGARASLWRFLSYPSLLEFGLVMLAFGFIAWRHTRRDVTLIVWLSLLIVTNLFVDKLGYVEVYQSLYYIPIGALVVLGLPEWFGVRRVGVVWLVLILLLAGQFWAAFLERPLIQVAREGQLSENIYVTMGERLRPLLSEDDIIVSEADIIWGLPDYHDRLYAYSIYPPNYERLGYDSPDAIWYDLAPTIFVETPLVTLSPELETYLIDNEFRLCETFDGLMMVYRPGCVGTPIRAQSDN